MPAHTRIVKVQQHICQRCGYVWQPRLPRVPKICPACKSPQWRTAKAARAGEERE